MMTITIYTTQTIQALPLIRLLSQGQYTADLRQSCIVDLGGLLRYT